MAADEYSCWAHDTFLSRIGPLTGRVSGAVLEGVDSETWIATCAPGPGPARYRLYPGALFLLWCEALGGAGSSRGAEPVAAALELIHNSSLVHDDVIDGHDRRRGQETLQYLHGPAFAVLAGDGLFGTALRMLASVEAARLAGILQRLGGL